MLADLEDRKEEIKESSDPQGLVTEFVDSAISVYTYEQIMIFANNNELWERTDDFGAGDIQGMITGAIFSYLSETADAWLFYNIEEQEEA